MRHHEVSDIIGKGAMSGNILRHRENSGFQDIKKVIENEVLELGRN